MFKSIVCLQGRASFLPISRRSYGTPLAHVFNMSTHGRVPASAPRFKSLPRPFPRINQSLRIRVRSYYRNHYDEPEIGDPLFNRRFTRYCVGTALLICGAWSYSESGVLYTVLEKQRAWLQSHGISVPRNLPTRPVYEFLNKYFVLNANDPYNPISWLGAALSDQDFIHVLFNMWILTGFAPMLYALPRRHFFAVIVGSALVSSGAFLLDMQRKAMRGEALGSSGIVCGVLTTVTMFYPTARMSFLPAPLWLITSGYFLADWYFMHAEHSSIRHTVDVGGALFGVFYYTLFLRRFGGVFGPPIRRF